ncbi:Plasmodium variant antigen protein Cir/Yir/Bir, putative [Plasmodium berghei]|uniref:Plasmodium variant antigen protein Cir/Yir/Bir, putative n=1 Tax=Plasmodium berghei TaxID=5821 RepID=A0A0Y9TI40_PLABE|nr:Plasmodium variant antigen protein Cir/Yir/Bir, putative [Plasmodium berghei]SBW38203.1 Plasmodium variant antigen protein Cir/Yir/Bir, putative [Plasmodium berghei]SCL82588.1 Plasmodium variant antigen protein Cir/Yir/Bir, putative [Plasmodium berghei]SCL83877.1 Plasmodium variant antigen protein Cir/Yir/Bir, putative [Plasmodium berghei]SCL83979.1 Plasmodium variant antigen protein Cir/Yir/Bir, putative [Plasmodium berghei]
MDKNMCKKFQDVKEWFPDQLDSKGNYQFKDDQLSNKFSVFKFVAKSNIDIIDYIVIWLSYMLSLKENETKNSLQYFYTTFINNDRYKNPIDKVEGCSSYKDLIVKKHDLTNADMDNNIISKLYDAFNILCNLHTEFNEHSPNCEEYLTKANEFSKKYKELKKYSSNNKNGSFSQILLTLSNDYANFKNKCNDIRCSNFSSFPTIEKAQSSEVTSSNSSIYSLFGFRKRAQKQYLREKIKNIKKRMNY